MKRKSTPISPEDAALFRDAIGEVRRIEAERAATDRPAPPPEPRRLRLDEAEALRESRDPTALTPLDAAEVLAFHRATLPAKDFRQLKRGQYSVQDEIDLHLLRTADAELLLKQFLNHAREQNRLCVRVIHGKGLRADGASVLKALVDRVLRHRGDVLGFASAPLNQGGTGAVLVLLAPRS